MGDFQSLLLIGAVGAFISWRVIKKRKMMKLFPELLASGAMVVDVRSPAEFAQGSSPNSLNIPLDLLAKRLGELDKSKTIVLCCASGARSGMALGILKAHGFQKVVNAGRWTNALVHS